MAPKDNNSAQLAADIQYIYSQDLRDESAIARQELEALARIQLGEDYDQEKIATVAQSQRWWREEQQAATVRLEHGELTPQAYLALLRQLTSEMAARCEKVLGDRDFERLFGIPAKDAADLLTPPS